MSETVTEKIETLQDWDLPMIAAREIRAHKRGFWIAGGLALLLGVVAIALPHAATLAVELAVGAVFILTGLAECMAAFGARKIKWIAGAFIVGLVTLGAGILLLTYPFSGTLAVTLFLTGYFIVSGLVKTYAGYQMKPANGWRWILGGGVATLGLGLLLWIALPDAADWALGLIVGVDLIIYGVGLISLVWGARQLLEQSGHGGDELRHNKPESVEV